MDDRGCRPLEFLTEGYVSHSNEANIARPQIVHVVGYRSDFIPNYRSACLGVRAKSNQVIDETRRACYCKELVLFIFKANGKIDVAGMKSANKDVVDEAKCVILGC